MVWYEELGFDENPFSTDPLEREDKVVGREKIKDEILYRIASGSIMLIVGKDGVGKTMLLKHAIDNFRGKGKVIYVDGNKVNKRLNVERLLLRGAGFVKGSMFKNKPKGMILLLDNVDNLSKKNNKLIKFYYDQDYLRSVVFTASNYGNTMFSDSIKDRIGNRIYKLKDLKEENVIEIVKDRLEGNDIISDEIIKEIYELSDKNMTKFLENCEKVCDYAISNGDEIVKRSHLGKAITKEDKKEKQMKKIEICDECGEELIEINEQWLCPQCDSFCTNCGAYIYGDELICPSCGLEFEEDEEEEKGDKNE